MLLSRGSKNATVNEIKVLQAKSSSVTSQQTIHPLQQMHPSSRQASSALVPLHLASTYMHTCFKQCPASRASHLQLDELYLLV